MRVTRRTPDGRTLRASVRLFEALLYAYPREFRDAYGREMTQAFRDLLREEQSGCSVGLWVRVLCDLVLTAFKERSEMMRAREFLLLGATALGMGIAWVDSRPTWDDTGITVGVLFFACAALGAISPKQAWQWALAVGIWIPLHGFLWAHNYGSIIALVPAFIGAYLGAGVRSLSFPPASQA